MALSPNDAAFDVIPAPEDDGLAPASIPSFQGTPALQLDPAADGPVRGAAAGGVPGAPVKPAQAAGELPAATPSPPPASVTPPVASPPAASPGPSPPADASTPSPSPPLPTATSTSQQATPTDAASSATSASSLPSTSPTLSSPVASSTPVSPSATSSTLPEAANAAVPTPMAAEPTTTIFATIKPKATPTSTSGTVAGGSSSGLGATGSAMLTASLSVAALALVVGMTIFIRQRAKRSRRPRMWMLPAHLRGFRGGANGRGGGADGAASSSGAVVPGSSAHGGPAHHYASAGRVAGTMPHKPAALFEPSAPMPTYHPTSAQQHAAAHVAGIMAATLPHTSSPQFATASRAESPSGAWAPVTFTSERVSYYGPQGVTVGYENHHPPHHYPTYVPEGYLHHPSMPAGATQVSVPVHLTSPSAASSRRTSVAGTVMRTLWPGDAHQTSVALPPTVSATPQHMHANIAQVSPSTIESFSNDGFHEHVMLPAGQAHAHAAPTVHPVQTNHTGASYTSGAAAATLDRIPEEDEGVEYSPTHHYPHEWQAEVADRAAPLPAPLGARQQWRPDSTASSVYDGLDSATKGRWDRAWKAAEPGAATHV